MFPDSYISLVQQMNAHQKEIYVHLYRAFVAQSDISGFLGELRTKLPEVYARLAPLILESVERSGRMSREANEFFAFVSFLSIKRIFRKRKHFQYGSNSGKLQKGTDNEITTFLREILPKWAKLDQKSKEDFRREYPKLAIFMEGKGEF